MLVWVGCTSHTGSESNELDKLSSESNELDRDHYYELFENEPRDITIKIKRDTVIDLNWTLRQINRLQHIGREKLDPRVDFLKSKFLLLDSESFIPDDCSSEEL